MALINQQYEFPCCVMASMTQTIASIKRFLEDNKL